MVIFGERGEVGEFLSISKGNRKSLLFEESVLCDFLEFCSSVKGSF